MTHPKFDFHYVVALLNKLAFRPGLFGVKHIFISIVYKFKNPGICL